MSSGDVQALLTVGVVYFVPLLVAVCRHHHQVWPIAIVNALLGWTFVGWVVALAWAFSTVKPRPVPAHLAVMPPPDQRDRLG